MIKKQLKVCYDSERGMYQAVFVDNKRGKKVTILESESEGAVRDCGYLKFYNMLKTKVVSHKFVDGNLVYVLLKNEARQIVSSEEMKANPYWDSLAHLYWMVRKLREDYPYYKYVEPETIQALWRSQERVLEYAMTTTEGFVGLANSSELADTEKGPSILLKFLESGMEFTETK